MEERLTIHVETLRFLLTKNEIDKIKDAFICNIQSSLAVGPRYSKQASSSTCTAQPTTPAQLPACGAAVLGSAMSLRRNATQLSDEQAPACVPFGRSTVGTRDTSSPARRHARSSSASGNKIRTRNQQYISTVMCAFWPKRCWHSGHWKSRSPPCTVLKCVWQQDPHPKTNNK